MKTRMTPTPTWPTALPPAARPHLRPAHPRPMPPALDQSSCPQRDSAGAAAGVWSIVQPWGASNTFTWTPPATAGDYVIEVLVRNTGANEDPYDAYIDVPYTLR